MMPPDLERRLELECRDFSVWQALDRYEARRKGAADLLIRVMTSKFGPIPAQIEASIRDARLFELYAMGERLFNGATPDEMLAAIE